jgi:hypothetical protein
VGPKYHVEFKQSIVDYHSFYFNGSHSCIKNQNLTHIFIFFLFVSNYYSNSYYNAWVWLNKKLFFIGEKIVSVCVL